jgi:hypothetical protein
MAHEYYGSPAGRDGLARNGERVNTIMTREYRTRHNKHDRGQTAIGTTIAAAITAGAAGHGKDKDNGHGTTRTEERNH